MSERTVHTFCRVCEPACGLLASVQGGRLESLRPDPEHPVSRGFACNKGLAGVEIHHDPDRLSHPQRRRADGRLERLGWDDATSQIAARLREITTAHGLDAVASYSESGTGSGTSG